MLTLHLTWKNFLSVVIGFCVVGLAFISLHVEPNKLKDWQPLVWGIAGIGIFCIMVQAFMQSHEDKQSKEREAERERREQERDKQLETIAKILEVQPAKASVAMSETVISTSDSGLRTEDPRVYVDLERIEKRFGDSVFLAPTSTFILRNEGGSEALKVQIDPLVLFKSKAEFDEVACIPSHKEVSVLPKTTERFEKNDIVKILMAEWDAKNELTDEYFKPMRITYKDFSGREFQTTFDIVVDPVRVILYRQLPPRREAYREVLFVRNIEVKPLFTQTA